MTDTLSTGELDSSDSSTIRFYEEHADEYFERTVNANLEHLYGPFLQLVSKAGSILDAGCGSGRDIKVFKKRGYCPFGVDASVKLVQLARAYTGVQCEVRRIQDINFEAEFDAVWACASLLHLPKADLNNALQRLRKALRKDGVLFASIQLGEGERFEADGRFYAYYEREEFLKNVRAAGFMEDAAWTTEDSLPNRPLIRWLNILAHVWKP